MNLKQAHGKLGWPEERRILGPSGGGPSHFTASAAAKIGTPLSRMAKAESGSAKIDIRTGLLCANPESDRTEAPLAVVCEFNRHVSIETLLEAHRLAWNFSHAPLLVTLEPCRVLVWSCSVCPSPPEADTSQFPFASRPADFSERLISCEITRPNDPLSDVTRSPLIEQGAIQALHWVNLLAGRHFQQNPGAFKPEGKLDATLIRNLLHVRNHLRDALDLREDRCHDLLARLIFVQFLFQRRDSQGRAALHRERLHGLTAKKILRKSHADLPGLLADYHDSYRFFEWLNERFNGDLFPGKGASATERKREWATEKAEVRPEHLAYLARFITGREDLPKSQGLLWSYYAFDTIPLELISSIYELFVGPAEKDKAYYTRGHLVDFMLDAVLPWQGARCDLRVLDPSCGSGIFLVKTFQRLVHRWKQAHDAEPKPSDLKAILEQQIFGVDINPEAIRVASFSLYLALCDELDPRYYWTREKLFPRLRGQNLIASDFFAEDHPPFRTKADAGTFDLVIGNAPWGKGSAKDQRSAAHSWAKENNWLVPGKDHGPVFLAKAACLTKPDGWVSMIQSGGLLLNRMEPARKFRKKLFKEFTFEEVIHLGAMRKQLFATATGPACITTFHPIPSAAGADFVYVAPKPQGTVEDCLRVVIEPHDIHLILHDLAASDDLIWSALMWGGGRDLALIKRLTTGETLLSMRSSGMIATREGMIRGVSKQRAAPEIIGRRLCADKEFPANAFLEVSATDFPVNRDPMVHERDSKNLAAFDPPQLIFKQGWRSGTNRFGAVLVRPDQYGKGALCSGSYVSLRAVTGDKDLLAAMWLLLNSSFACYWFPLTGGKFANFIPEATETELRQLPALRFPADQLPAIAAEGYAAIDRTVLDLLDLNEAERILVEDLHQVVLPDAQRQGGNPPGQQPVTPEELDAYALTFRKVIKATFGEDRPVCATVYHPPGRERLPIQLVAIHLNWKGRPPVRREAIETPELLEKLLECYTRILKQPSAGIGFQRVVEVITSLPCADGPVPTIYLAKPAQRRYWLRSLAMRDADRFGALLLLQSPATRA